LGEGWSYEASESLSVEISGKLNSLKSNHPSQEFYVVKGISGKAEGFNANEILEKYAFKTYYLSTEGNHIYVILGKIDKEILEIITEDQGEDFKEDVFKVVDVQPEPIGGIPAFFEYVANNLKYPEEAKNAGVEGKVFIEYVVTKDGTIANVKCIRGISESCNSEAIRVIRNSPAWKPGKHEGKNVNVRMILPITFKLGGSAEKKQE
jgi:TonB family protein